jgi:hypothetical protein
MQVSPASWTFSFFNFFSSLPWWSHPKRTQRIKGARRSSNITSKRKPHIAFFSPWQTANRFSPGQWQIADLILLLGNQIVHTIKLAIRAFSKILTVLCLGLMDSYITEANLWFSWECPFKSKQKVIQLIRKSWQLFCLIIMPRICKVLLYFANIRISLKFARIHIFNIYCLNPLAAPFTLFSWITKSSEIFISFSRTTFARIHTINSLCYISRNIFHAPETLQLYLYFAQLC